MRKKKQFRAERIYAPRREQHDNELGQDTPTPKSSEDLEDFINEIKAVRQDIKTLGESLSPEKLRKEHEEAVNLKREIKALHDAITSTKKEIAAIRHPNAKSDHLATAEGELDAIVGATENAANIILESTEKIEEIITELKNSSNDHYAIDRMENINMQVVSIYEACNFQDLTGQRITKIIQTLKHIDERITAMIGIWGPGEFNGIPVNESEKSDNGEPALHGPARPDEAVSQADIDAMFD